MLESIIHKLFWSKALEGIREGHREMCYKLGVKDGQYDLNKDNKFYKELSDAYKNESIISQ